MKDTSPGIALLIGVAVTWLGWYSHLYGRKIQSDADSVYIKQVVERAARAEFERDDMEKNCKPQSQKVKS